jgi:RNA polymerase sigma factor (sigma-70 family)
MDIDNDDIVFSKLNNHDIDNEVLDYLYVNMKEPITKFIKLNNGSDEDSSDIIQDTLLIFLEKDDYKFETKANAIAFLVTIASRRWIDKLRRKKNESLAFQEFADDSSKIRYSYQNSFELNIVDLKEALEELSVECRNILREFYFEQEELSLKEISEKYSYSYQYFATNLIFN